TVPASVWPGAVARLDAWACRADVVRGSCRPHPAARERSGRRVVRAQRAVGAQEPFARLRLELRTALHLRLVDVQRDRDRIAAGVGDRVVLVRRDQAARAAGAGVHAAGGAEAEAIAVAFEQLVLGD